MNLQKIFLQKRAELGLNDSPIYPIAGGECSLNQDKTIALVWSDGRYPKIEDGYSLNKVCTETMTVLYGACILEIGDQISIFREGESFSIKPNTKYSISAKAICKVEISPPWESKQNTFVL